MADYGKVYIMGVGPGDYRLMTLKAADCIREADVIVYDRLINNKIVSYARPEAELVYVGKLPDCHAVPQEEINEILVKKALEGKTVARVKGGDPFVFGRGGEEAEALWAKGIEFEIIPGVTSAIAVPAYAGIPVTHRDFCSSLHIITGHERPGKSDSAIDYKLLAQVEGTLIFLMGVKSLPEITRRLMDSGKDGRTPAAVIEKGTTARQRIVAGTLEDIAGRVAEAGIESPAVTVIGKVVALREKIHWFPKGRLAGKRVIVTRPKGQASKLAKRIEELGGEALEFPVVGIAEPPSFRQLDAALERIKSFQWLVFTSVNGVDAFFSRMKAGRTDIRVLSGIKHAVVGEATAEALFGYGILADYVPEKYTAEDLAEGLAKIIPCGEKVLVVRAEEAGSELREVFQNKGIGFEEAVAYRTVYECTAAEELLDTIKEGKADYLTFTSSSAVTSFMSAIGAENLKELAKIRIACIGPVTARTAENAGMTVAATAAEHTINGLVDTLATL